MGLAKIVIEVAVSAEIVGFGADNWVVVLVTVLNVIGELGVDVNRLVSSPSACAVTV